MARARHIMLKNKQGDSKLLDVFLVLIYSLFTLICVFPFYYLIINTISDNRLVSIGAIMFLPKGIHLKNYADVFKMEGILNSTMISVARTVLGTLLMLACTCFLGYAFSRREYWHKKFFYRFVIVTMYFSAGMVPHFINIKNLGLMNSFWVYVLPGAISAYNMILFKTYVESIPEALEESAALDGAGYLIRFARIVMPLCKPILATITVFTAVGQWNAFMDSLYYISNPKLYTLQFRLYQYLSHSEHVAMQMRNQAGMSAEAMEALAHSMNPTSLRMTITVVVVLPVMCFYPFFQRYFVKGIMIGAVKS